MAAEGPGRAFQAIESRVANPVLRVVLRTPLHRLVGGSLMLLTYEGRRSGRDYSTPVAYVRDEGAVVVTTFLEEATWWRNFRDGHPATLWLQGQPVAATGRATTDAAAVADWLETLRERASRFLGFFGVPDDPDRADLERSADGLVVVRFELE